MAGNSSISSQSTPTKGSSAENRWSLLAVKTAAQTMLFGYDFFISYRTADASTCARSLHAALTKTGFDCFLDVQHYEAGRSLPLMQSQALRRSTKLLILVSPRAHLSPEKGTDWLLAEVHEFKRLAKQRGVQPAIIPIGTPITLSEEIFPGSKLLPEIPTPSAKDICIFDAATESNGEIATTTVAKLENDFREFRRRRVRQAVSWGAVLAIVCAIGFGFVSLSKEQEAQKTVKLGTAFSLLDLGRELMDRGNVEKSQANFSQSVSLFNELGRDPLMALHHQFAGRLQQLRATKIADVERETSYLKLSSDGEWLLVVYDYQAPNGNPDMEDILDWTAFGLFNVTQRKWTIRQTLRSEIGKEIYEGADVVALAPPNHAIIRAGGFDNAESFDRVSLEDGTRTKVVNPLGGQLSARSTPASTGAEEDNSAKARVKALLAPERLFVTDPNDGIDMEYGPRLVGKTYVEAPNRRTAIVGTYEGRLMLVDLAAGLNRGEMKTDTVYAAAYRPDGSRGYFCDSRNLWEIDTSGGVGVCEIHASLHSSPENSWHDEKVLAATLSDDALVVAVATTHRLLCYDVRNGNWLEWSQPRHIEKAAALRADSQRSRIDFVVGDDGTILCADYSRPSSRLDVIPRPGGPVPTVAWIDPLAPTAWLVGTKWTNGTTHVHAVPLPGGKSEPVKLSVAMPPAEKSLLEDDVMNIHALGKSDRTMIIIHGDKNSSDDSRDILGEQMLLIPLDKAKPQTNRVIFESKRYDNGPDNLWTCTQITSILPNSRPNSIFARTDPRGVYAVGMDAHTEKSLGELFTLEHRDDGQSYLMGVDSKETDAWFVIRHSGTGAMLRYQLPWGTANPPEFATISPGGRKVMLASARGEVLLLDVSKENGAAPDKK